MPPALTHTAAPLPMAPIDLFMPITPEAQPGSAACREAAAARGAQGSAATAKEADSEVEPPPRAGVAGDAEQLAQDIFGHDRLRPGQQQVIRRMRQGLSTLALMPTGAGKSLCYQLSALLLPGRAVVVSPLISLMKDQCEKLQARGICAVQFNSQCSEAELEDAERQIRSGAAKLVFTTPERLTDAAFLDLLAEGETSMLVVDEAHCIAQWGHDFRPAFLDLPRSFALLGHPPVLALTATANDEVVKEIRGRLNIAADGLVQTGTFRPNLRYAVHVFASEADRQARARELLAGWPGSGIVYVATVKAAKELHAALLNDGLGVGLYHGKLGAAQRRQAQDAFMQGQVRVMVATNAFGLGIDKPDIRFVLHYQMPASLQSYYQESGRAGRDGQAADCVLLHCRRDKAVQQFFLAGNVPQVRHLEAVQGCLRSPPPEASTWTEETLKGEAGLPAASLRSALQLLRQHGAVLRQSSGALKWRGRALTATRAQALVAAECERREREQQALERMTYYASSGLCRWSLLLDAFGRGEHTQRCDTCDNCRRMTALDSAAQPPAQEEVPGGEYPPLPPGSSSAPIDVRLTPGQPVRVPKYGRGRVVGEDAAGVQVEFADGAQRCFLRAFVQPVRTRGGAPERPSAGRALTEAAQTHPTGTIVVPGKLVP